jgi:choline dehydrogenase-like flavoprotein
MAAMLLETWNVGMLRTEFGKWRQVLPLRLVFDVLPDPDNRVRLNPADPARPEVHYKGHSDYTQKAIDRAEADLARVLAPLPVEGIKLDRKLVATEAHVIGTTVMGNDPVTSIVDQDAVHHRLRNLLVLGSSTFPTGGPANPTLTIAAQAMRAADRVMG